MTMHILNGNEIATGGNTAGKIVAEYEAKCAAAEDALEEFRNAQLALERAASVGGAYGDFNMRDRHINARDLHRSLAISAWRHLWDSTPLHQVATASQRQRFEWIQSNPPAFTVENILKEFGDIVSNPRQNILRGLAEVFSSLDPYYRSHEKMKVGVKGLPKRVILPGMDSIHGIGRDRLRDVLNALAGVQGLPVVTHPELLALMDDGDIMREPFELQHRIMGEKKLHPARGVWLKRFQNGNGHLFFDPETLRLINLALAEFYGEVLPDCPEARPDKKQASTEVAKDLQFYPTPLHVIEHLCDMDLRGRRVLEPSCGDGRIVRYAASKGAVVQGVEYDQRHAEALRNLPVLFGNFLESDPIPEFDLVLMNPPFYGQHYAKHVRHALKFLKPGGSLHAILPATARYDHGLLDDLNPRWSDLPVGSFRESGTNINTVIARIRP